MLIGTCLLQVALAQQQLITRNLTVCWVNSPVATLTIDLLADTVPGARAVTNLRAVRIPQVGTGARAGTTYVLTASVDPGEAGRTAVLTYFVTPPTGPRVRVKINILVLQTGARSVCLEAACRRFSTPVMQAGWQYQSDGSAAPLPRRHSCMHELRAPKRAPLTAECDICRCG